MPLTYIGNCEWLPAAEPQQSGRAEDVPTLSEPWVGRSDKLESFLSGGKQIGSPYLGGYITSRSSRDGTPGPGLATVDFVVSLRPDFNANRSSIPGYSIKSLTLTAQHESDLIEPGCKYFYLSRDLVASCPSVSFNYYSSSRPSGPRNTSVPKSTEIKVLRDTIFVDCYDSNWSWKKRYELGPTSIHADLKAKVAVKEITSAELGASPIDGAPWWQCQDTLVLEYAPDTGGA